ncbi:RRQRL motif-containing zinc-binding protein [Streptomyces sp. NRRL S-1868]|uniref:RRQRL motif-containing zinc-binding protein n=1 Tax=Streptomyces sp. NRRL S-1868 TaxID=1463892 RepID=UPI0004C6A065|nr:RRQRL motif-containing zinc-binding protein [Streptomyces sp. NRRL S-1868]
MADQDQDLVDVDPYDLGDGSLPVFRWRQAGRENLATRRQLREMGLRPGGQEPVARIECRGGKRFAWLYRIDLAKPKFAMTLAKEAALDKAMAARQTCPGPCGRRYLHCLPLKTLGSCLECFDGTLADPASYTTPPAKHLLAA